MCHVTIWADLCRKVSVIFEFLIYLYFKKFKDKEITKAAEIYTISVYNTITGQYEEVTVTKEVYHEYRRGEWRIRKNDEKHRANETSFCALNGGENVESERFREFSDTESNPEIIIMKKALRSELYQAIYSLNESDRSLIRAIFYEKKSEQEIVARNGVTQQMISRKKRRILKKLKKFFHIGVVKSRFSFLYK